MPLSIFSLGAWNWDLRCKRPASSISPLATAMARCTVWDARISLLPSSICSSSFWKSAIGINFSKAACTNRRHSNDLSPSMWCMVNEKNKQTKIKRTWKQHNWNPKDNNENHGTMKTVEIHKTHSKTDDTQWDVLKTISNNENDEKMWKQWMRWEGQGEPMNIDGNQKQLKPMKSIENNELLWKCMKGFEND